jgi:hypothetical protein
LLLLLLLLAGRLQDSISRMQERVRSSFIPRKEDVTEDYWEWLKWRCGQVCMQLCMVLCYSVILCNKDVTEDY